MNPFMHHLQRKGIKLWESPRPNEFGFCSREWDPYQTCCDPDSAVAYAGNDSKNIKRQVQNLGEEYNKFLEFIKSAEDSILELKILSKMSKKAIDKKIIKSLKRAYKRIEHLLQNLMKWRQQAPDLQKFQVDNQKCWGYMASIRQSMICSACSGRSENFFIGNKAIIHPGQCSKVVQVCSSSFIGLVNYLQAIRNIVQLLRIKDTSRGFLTLTGNMKTLRKEKVNEFLRFYQEQNFEEILESQNLAEELKKEKDGILARTICRLTFSLHHQSIIELFDNLVDTGSLRIEMSQDLVKGINKMRGLRRNILRRLVQSKVQYRKLTSGKRRQKKKKAAKLPNMILSKISKKDTKALRKVQNDKKKALQKRKGIKSNKSKISKQRVRAKISNHPTQKHDHIKQKGTNQSQRKSGRGDNRTKSIGTSKAVQICHNPSRVVHPKGQSRPMKCATKRTAKPVWGGRAKALSRRFAKIRAVRPGRFWRAKTLSRRFAKRRAVRSGRLARVKTPSSSSARTVAHPKPIHRGVLQVVVVRKTVRMPASRRSRRLSSFTKRLRKIFSSMREKLGSGVHQDSQSTGELTSNTSSSQVQTSPVETQDTTKESETQGRYSRGGSRRRSFVSNRADNNLGNESKDINLNELADVVVMRDSDGMFDTHMGKGTGHDCDNKHFVPMNLTMAFP